MIGKLRGRVDTVREDHLILDVNGVGYVVFASSRTLSQLDGLTGEVGLIIETHVREDHIHLYGFMSEAERDCFRLLTTVQGVGSRVGMAILAIMGSNEVITAIAAQDATFFTRASGVGKKLAERIVNELKNKVSSLSVAATPAKSASGKKSAQKDAASGLREDAVSALVHLGYARMDAFQAVARAMQEEEEAGLDAIIKRSLSELAA